MSPRVDVVIATKDRPQSLARTLEALAVQSFRDFAVVVVDDGSREPVANALPPGLAGRLQLRVVRREQSGGPGPARNAGVAAGDGMWIAFIDDDIETDPDMLARHLAAVERAGPGAVSIGPCLAPPGWRSTVWNHWDAAKVEHEYERMLRGEYEPTWRQFFTGNVFLRRADFLAVEGFDERFKRAEDIELGLRLHERGCRFVFTHDAVAYHHSERSLAGWLGVPRAYGRFDVVIDALHPAERWLATIRQEERERRAFKRTVRRILGQPVLRPVSTRAATWTARALWRAGVARPAMRALSLAYALEYRAALAGALAEPPAELRLFEASPHPANAS